MANQDQEPNQQVQSGFCSATCVDKASLQEEIKKPELKTSDFFTTCNLPKRFEHPHWFNGYGCQVSKQHPFYRTSASEYGWYPQAYTLCRRCSFRLGKRSRIALQPPECIGITASTQEWIRRDMYKIMSDG